MAEEKSPEKHKNRELEILKKILSIPYWTISTILKTPIALMDPANYTNFLMHLTNVNKRIQKNLHLNFITLLGTHKIDINVMDDTLDYFYHNRNKSWFQKFFRSKGLYELVKKDIERWAKDFPRVKLTITKEGTLIYDNYKKNKFNILLLTIHSGTWVPHNVDQFMKITSKQRYCEEDVGTDVIYSPLVLKKGGIWIDTKQSRFACDYNRKRERAIYTNTSEPRLKNIWKEPPFKKDREKILKRYDEFYHILDMLIETYRFNIIFDGHSMVDVPDRPSLSFGIKYVPQFYLPIVAEMREKLSSVVGEPVHINNPFKGGHILRHLSQQYPDVFIFSMEINKAEYMNQAHTRFIYRKMPQLSDMIVNMFEFRKTFNK